MFTRYLFISNNNTPVDSELYNCLEFCSNIDIQHCTCIAKTEHIHDFKRPTNFEANLLVSINYLIFVNNSKYFHFYRFIERKKNK